MLSVTRTGNAMMPLAFRFAVTIGVTVEARVLVVDQFDGSWIQVCPICRQVIENLLEQGLDSGFALGLRLRLGLDRL